MLPIAVAMISRACVKKQYHHSGATGSILGRAASKYVFSTTVLWRRLRSLYRVALLLKHHTLNQAVGDTSRFLENSSYHLMQA